MAVWNGAFASAHEPPPGLRELLERVPLAEVVVGVRLLLVRLLRGLCGLRAGARHLLPSLPSSRTRGRASTRCACCRGRAWSPGRTSRWRSSMFELLALIALVGEVDRLDVVAAARGMRAAASDHVAKTRAFCSWRARVYGSRAHRVKHKVGLRADSARRLLPHAEASRLPGLAPQKTKRGRASSAAPRAPCSRPGWGARGERRRSPRRFNRPG